MRRRAAGLGILAVVAALGACGDDGPDPLRAYVDRSCELQAELVDRGAAADAVIEEAGAADIGDEAAAEQVLQRASEAMSTTRAVTLAFLDGLIEAGAPPAEDGEAFRAALVSARDAVAVRTSAALDDVSALTAAGVAADPGALRAALDEFDRIGDEALAPLSDFDEISSALEGACEGRGTT